MRATSERPAFYALGGGRLGELLTLLHPPYTAWHLSYFALGAAVAPRVHLDRLLWGLAAFALAVGVAAHALDELHDRPLGTSLSDRALVAMAAAAGAGALAIGVAGAIVVTPALVPLVIAGGLFLPAYNLELARGRFHSDAWFALGWGAFPAFTGYFVEAQTLRIEALAAAAFAFTASLAQRTLSTPVRRSRRAAGTTAGIEPLERALRLLVWAMVALALVVLSADLKPNRITVTDAFHTSAARMIPIGVVLLFMLGAVVLFRREEPYFAERV